MRNLLAAFKGPQGFILGLWLLSSLTAIIVPASIWGYNRNEYYKYVGVYNEYAQNQEQYEQQQNGDDNNNNNNNNYQNYGNPCSWWNFSCRKKYAKFMKYYQNNGQQQQQGDENQIMLPGWYKFLGGKVQVDEKEREELGISESSGSVKFVYSWTLLMFLVLVLFGSRVLYKAKDRTGLVALLILYFNFMLLNLLTVVNGVIETEARQLDDSIYGWSGQWGVLVAYTDFWMLLHSVIFACLFGIPACMKSRSLKKGESKDTEDSTVEMRNYEPPQDANHYDQLA
eukprot:CAMPEP_0194222602 /NCGR_PEP_ID=MMETSP0156-20130528/33336_1 /TAXON_ID=33649 /ORGANISM="Thalassionema nitzschioides, Strain L26-B" /LENGTH=283 /DNA_ID=CAMNT_0038953459 /DNA_START=23 /DNA_END=874 /DNA_ORIENTATION=+